MKMKNTIYRVIIVVLLLSLSMGYFSCQDPDPIEDNDDPSRWSRYGFEGREILQLRFFGDWLYAIIRGDAGLYRRNVRAESSEWESLETANPSTLYDVYVNGNDPGFMMASGHWVDKVDSTVHVILVSWDDGDIWTPADSGMTIMRGQETLEIAPYYLEAALGKIYAASNYGLFVTEDAGESWDSLWVLKSLAYYSLAYFVVHPTNPQYMWRLFGLAEGYNPAPNVEYSTDEGKSWKRISDYSRDIFTWPTDIDLHPENPDIVYVTTDDSLYKTTDGGANWTQITYYDSTVWRYSGALAFDSSNPSHLFVTVEVYDENLDSSFFILQESYDGGENWDSIDSPYYLYFNWQMRYDPVGQALYLSVFGPLKSGGTIGGILRYDASP